ALASDAFATSTAFGYVGTMKSDDLIAVDREILGERHVFNGSRVAVKWLFNYLEHNYTLYDSLSYCQAVPSTMVDSFGAIGNGPALQVVRMRILLDKCLPVFPEALT